MSKRIVKYQPFTQKEIDVYKKETSVDENFKEQKINYALILLRRSYLKNVKSNIELERVTSHFNKVIRAKNVDEIVKLIRIYLKKD